jgi:hypothetical protein
MPPLAGHWWLTPIILATQEAEIRPFKASPGKQFARPYLKKVHHKKRAGVVAQSVGPEFKLQYRKKKHKMESEMPNFSCF